MEAVIFIGLQGSGKSTFFKEKFFDTHVRINLDMLRTRHREGILLDACISGKTKFVVDNTNTLVAERARYVAPAKQAGFKIVGYYFVPDVEGCVRRNAARSGKACIPDNAIFATKKQLQEPTFDEHFDQLYTVEISPPDGAFQIKEIER